MHSDAERNSLRLQIKAAAAGRDAAAVPALGRALLAGSTKPADTMLCASAFASVGDALVERGAKRLKVFIVRSVTVEPILPSLTVEAALAGYVLEVEVGGYGSYVDEMMNPASQLSRSGADLVLVLLDLEELAGRLPALCADGRGEGVEDAIAEAASQAEQMIVSFRRHGRGQLLLQGCAVPAGTALGEVGESNLPGSLVYAIHRLNERLAGICRGVSGCVFFDVDQIAASYGRKQWRDTRLFLASRLAVAPAAFSAYARGLVRSFSVLFRPARKVLCTDLDNTLWGGVLGEEGPEGIATGSAFPGNSYLEYQRYLKRLSARGVLLAVVSKNNPADVEEAFRVRAADLALRLEDFAALKIGWNDKSQSLRELAAQLSLGLDSFVFVDDNPVECEAIRRHLPEIAVVAAPITEPWTLVERLAAESFFDAASVTEDDVKRSVEYKAQAQRSALSQSSGSRDEFLASLGIVCTFVSALEAPLARSAQLLAKTNQFNLTTRRHSAAEIEAFAAAPGGQAVAVRVRDRFGDAGVVGLALARGEGDCCVIDSLLLSCRVIGRGIESALLAHVAAHAARIGLRWIVGEYVDTRKNAPCAQFYNDHGFTEDASLTEPGSASKFYRFDLAASLPRSPAWLTLEGNTLHELSTAVAL